MGALEQAWRAWLRLGERDRERFLRLFREAHAQEMEARRRTNGTAHAYRGLSSLNGLTLDGAVLEQPPETSFEELTLGEGW